MAFWAGFSRNHVANSWVDSPFIVTPFIVTPFIVTPFIVTPFTPTTSCPWVLTDSPGSGDASSIRPHATLPSSSAKATTWLLLHPRLTRFVRFSMMFSKSGLIGPVQPMRVSNHGGLTHLSSMQGPC